MAQLSQTHVVDENNTERDFPIIPAGDYQAIIEASDYVPNKAGTGMVLKLTWQVLDEGKFKGSKVFEQLNLENQSEQAERIAKAALNSICIAAGVGAIQDSAQLHGIPMMIKVGIDKPTDDRYEPKNIVKKHFPLGGATSSASDPAPASSPAKTQTPAPASPTGAKPTGVKPAWAGQGKK